MKRIFLLLSVVGICAVIMMKEHIGPFRGVSIMNHISALTHPASNSSRNVTVASLNNSLGDGPNLDARSAILLNAETGKIYYESNADESLPPASMSKMMTELLTYESIKKGKADWDDTVEMSKYAASVPGAETGLMAGDQLTLRTMFQAMAVHSSNDAAVAIAEHLAGSEQKFVQRMNERARKLGLSSGTHFANANGLGLADIEPYSPEKVHGDTVMTARDIAKLAAYLIDHYPEILKVTQMKEVKLPQLETGNLSTTNMMLPGEPFAYPGNDGLKTGFTDQAGYCFTGTSEQDGIRLIAVVMGTATAEARFSETQKLFAFGFEHS